MKIIPLSEGAFTVDQSKKFIPFNAEKDDLQKRNKGSILVEIQPFVIITSKDILLLDTGLGFANEDDQLQISKNLAAHGINPSDISKVLISHLHKDHTGGIAQSNKKIVNFENATYYINKNEFNFALERGFPSYHKNDFLLMEKYSNTIFTEGNGIIDDYIHYEVTGAHCQFHQVFKIIDNNDIVFFGGDVAPQLHQMKSKFKAKYDFDGKAAMEIKTKMVEFRKRREVDFSFLSRYQVSIL